MSPHSVSTSGHGMCRQNPGKIRQAHFHLLHFSCLHISFHFTHLDFFSFFCFFVLVFHFLLFVFSFLLVFMLCMHTLFRACGRLLSHPRPTRERAPVYRACPAGTHWGDNPSSQDDGSSSRQLVRVSCALVMVVCVLRSTCTDRNRHWIVSPLRPCMPRRHKRQGILPIHSQRCYPHAP